MQYDDIDTDAEDSLLSGEGVKCSNRQQPTTANARLPNRGQWAYLLLWCLFALTAPYVLFRYNRWALPYVSSWATENDGTLGTQYLLGVGKADITGPVVEINMMGYADPKQVGSGLRQRLYSRAFIVGDMERPTDRFVYLCLTLSRVTRL